MKNIILLTLSNEFNLATFIVGILSLCGVVINGIEFEKAEESTSSTSTSIFEDEELEEVKKAADDMKEILEAEAELIKLKDEKLIRKFMNN